MCLPHVVCLGAEKAFLQHAELIGDGSELGAIDSTFFRHLVAKAKLFRTTEDLFSSQDLTGYRAQSVAYAVSWLVHHSEKRIHLDRIWDQQRVGAATCDALTKLCHAAHAHILGQPGNPGEASKREPCWAAFRDSSPSIGDAWRGELSETAFVPVASDDDALAAAWKVVRQHFTSDTRTLAELEAVTGKQWVAKRRKDLVSEYAGFTWTELKTKGGLGPVKLRGLLELLAAVAEGS
jgi:hypothetical protein